MLGMSINALRSRARSINHPHPTIATAQRNTRQHRGDRWRARVVCNHNNTAYCTVNSRRSAIATILHIAYVLIHMYILCYTMLLCAATASCCYNRINCTTHCTPPLSHSDSYRRCGEKKRPSLFSPTFATTSVSALPHDSRVIETNGDCFVLCNMFVCCVVCYYIIERATAYLSEVGETGEWRAAFEEGWTEAFKTLVWFFSLARAGRTPAASGGCVCWNSVALCRSRLWARFGKDCIVFFF